MAEKIDKNNSGFIEFDEFVMMMKTRMLEDKNVELEIERAFDYFDDDGDVNIQITLTIRVVLILRSLEELLLISEKMFLMKL